MSSVPSSEHVADNYPGTVTGSSDDFLQSLLLSSEAKSNDDIQNRVKTSNQLKIVKATKNFLYDEFKEGWKDEEGKQEKEDEVQSSSREEVMDNDEIKKIDGEDIPTLETMIDLDDLDYLDSSDVLERDVLPLPSLQELVRNKV